MKRERYKTGRRGERVRRGDGKDVRREPEEALRLNRYIALAGVCSRRKADELIEQGRVRVNGVVVTNFATRVSSRDLVAVNGRRISPATYQYVLLNKPSDTITTTEDERDRQTVLDIVNVPDDEKEGLFPVGRLDRHTTGVLLLTNDGELANRLMHPRYEVDKLYRVVLDRPMSEDDLQRLLKGVQLEDGLARADYAAVPDPAKPKVLGIAIHEGRNRQIRRMIGQLGYTVEKLERINYAGLTTKGLRRGKWRRLEDYEVESLYRRVRLKTK